MTPERREKIRHWWGASLTFAREWVALLMGVYYAAVGTHGMFIRGHPDLSNQELALCVFAGFLIFGIRGLDKWHDVRKSALPTNGAVG